jgi:hypothetical protein
LGSGGDNRSQITRKVLPNNLSHLRATGISRTQDNNVLRHALPVVDRALSLFDGILILAYLELEL